jgi:hypothetical protein
MAAKAATHATLTLPALCGDAVAVPIRILSRTISMLRHAWAAAFAAVTNMFESLHTVTACALPNRPGHGYSARMTMQSSFLAFKVTQVWSAAARSKPEKRARYQMRLGAL